LPAQKLTIFDHIAFKLYHTSEFALKGSALTKDSPVQLNFPGGWHGDPANKFTNNSRHGKDKLIHEQAKVLTSYRKTLSAFTTGKMML